MKYIYPAVFTKEDVGYSVYIPDFNIGTQGDDLPDAIDMAQDAISLMGIVSQDQGKPIPQPSPIEMVQSSEGDLVLPVEVDFDQYRQENPLLPVE